MLNIRKSIFETNSSSMHSIVIAKNKDKSLDDYFYHDWENCPTLELTETDLEFGRGPFNFLNTFEEKLCYLIAAVNFKDNEFNQLIDIVNQILKERSEENLKEFDELNTENIKITHVIREGSPAKVILEVANEENVDLIVMGSSGKSGFDRFIMGSVADKVVNSAKCAVLVVH